MYYFSAAFQKLFLTVQKGSPKPTREVKAVLEALGCNPSFAANYQVARLCELHATGELLPAAAFIPAGLQASQNTPSSKTKQDHFTSRNSSLYL